MIKPCFFVLLVISTLMSQSCSFDQFKKDPPLITRGVLDLRGWNIEMDGSVKLTGEWEFYWEMFLDQDSFLEDRAPSKTGYIDIPESWNGYRTNDNVLPGTGYATYRTRILLDQVNESLAFRIMTINTAYALYVNGIKLNSVGVPGKNEKTTIPKFYPQVIDFMPKSNQLDVVLHISNFHDQRGGPLEPITFGTKAGLQIYREMRLLAEIFIAGSIFIMALYHLSIYFLRKSEKSPLYFGLFCSVYTIFIMLRGERFFFQLFTDVHWEIMVRLGFVIHALAIFFFIMFIHSLFEENFLKRILQIIQVITILFILIALFAPLSIHAITGDAVDIFTIVCGTYIIVTLVVAFLKKREGAGLFLVGFLIFFVAVVNDILYLARILPTSIIVPFGLLAFIFIKAYLLSRRLNMAFYHVEDLTEELKEKSVQLENVNLELKGFNRKLEEKVTQRTQELKKNNKELQNEISERQMAEQLLRESEEQFRSLSEQSFMGIFIIFDDHFKYANKAAADIMGHSVDNILAIKKISFDSIIFHEDLDQVNEQWQNYISEDNNFFQMPMRIITGNQVTKWIDVYGKSINYQGKKAELITVIDITDRKETERKLEIMRKDMMESAHRAGMADVATSTLHNVGNILNSIKTSSHLINESIQKSPVHNLVKANELLRKHEKDMKDFILNDALGQKLLDYYLVLEKDFSTQHEQIQQDAIRLNGMVDSIVEVISAQQAYAAGASMAELFNVEEIVEDSINVQKESLTQHNIQLNKNFQKVPAIKVQKSKLLHILTNLIINAIHALNYNDVSERKMDLSIAGDKNYVFIRISDNGHGINKENSNKIFNYGFTTKKNGHGYGLHSCANYMIEMGGEINVKSEGQGKGATFELVFPINGDKTKMLPSSMKY